ncbi:unnamed protein product [Adineta ricciae]|uniref:Uncharacterized protein n=1 Tax=Adineta ricciae TaxID=249248 RepID=A0A816C2D3_ADIRI|nr:unnamed protein product [Adineta ricciae]
MANNQETICCCYRERKKQYEKTKTNKNDTTNIRSIVNAEEYKTEREQFLDYCARKEKSKLDRRELETALRTLIELLKNHLNKSFKGKEFELNIPELENSSYTYEEGINIFINILIQCASNLDEDLDKFKQCLKDTLEKSLKNNEKDLSYITWELNVENIIFYLTSFICAPCCLIGTLICSLKTYISDKKLRSGPKSCCIEFWSHFVYTVCIGLIIFNIIQFYWFNVLPSKANELEIYWPVALIISMKTVLNVYQTSKEYRDRRLSKEDLSFQSLTKMDSFHGNLRSKGYLYYIAYLLVSISASVILGILHSFIPIIYRSTKTNETLRDMNWQVNTIRYSYVAFSCVFYSLLIWMMVESIGNYSLMLWKLKKLFLKTNLFGNISLESGNLLNLYKSDDLEFFVSLFQPIKRKVDPYNLYLSTMTCALVIDGLLILTTVVHLFIYGKSFHLLIILCSIDILILSFSILIFLTIVVFINKLMTTTLVLHLKNIKVNSLSPIMNDGNENGRIRYLNAVIEYMEYETKENAIKLFGLLVIDHKLAIKVVLSVIASFGSQFIAYFKQE